jgi:hypothetical protein
MIFCAESDVKGHCKLLTKITCHRCRSGTRIEKYKFCAFLDLKTVQDDKSALLHKFTV